MAGPVPVMCLATPFRTRPPSVSMKPLRNIHLAYVKLDLTTIFNAYGEAPGCWAKGHDHANWAESLDRIYEGISYITAKVYQKHPDVLLDLTFELWGQKHIIDAGLLAAGDLDWMSNVDDNHPDSAGPRQARTLLYQRAASMPVESMLIGNIHGELPTIQESFATEIGSAPVLLGDLRNLTAADQQWYRDKISWFKNLRITTKSAKVFPAGHLASAFTVHLGWLRAAGAQWPWSDGRVSKQEQRGYRADSASADAGREIPGAIGDPRQGSGSVLARRLEARCHVRVAGIGAGGNRRDFPHISTVRASLRALAKTHRAGGSFCSVGIARRDCDTGRRGGCGEITSVI